MIPDFKTFIKESIWADIQDRSSGDVTRIEDDIDLMDKETFCEYLKDNYDCETDYTITSFDADNKDELDVNVFRNQNRTLFFTLKVDYFNNDPYVAVFRPLPGIIKPLRDKLEDRYDVWEDNDDESGAPILVINPKDGSDYSNRFFVDVLDFVLDNTPKQLVKLLSKKTGISESIWSDIQDRSSGDVIRKEDDINLLDETGLVNYMEKVYMSPNDDIHIIGDTLSQGSILASLFDIDGKYYNIIYQKISTNKPEITFPVCQESDIENKLSKLYKVTRLKQYNDKIYKIEPNDGNKITNKFFLEVLDFILKEAEGKYTILLKKK